MKKPYRNSIKFAAAAMVLSLFLNGQAALAFYPTLLRCKDDLLPCQNQPNSALNDPEYLFRNHSTGKQKAKSQRVNLSDLRAQSLLANSSIKLTPEQMYAKAWEEVKLHFVDRTFSGQDWNRWKNKYKGRLQTVEAASKAINTMIYSLGDTNTFLSDCTLEPAVISGIGIKLAMKPGHTVFVFEPIEGSPAARAGIKKDWEITHINGRSTKSDTLDQVADQIRGESGTPVQLSFLDGKIEKSVTVLREKIAAPTIVKSCTLDSEVGYIRVGSLKGSTCAELKNALAKLTGTRSLILDLRDCDGHEFLAGMNVADLFIPPNICITRVRFNDGAKPVTRAYYSSEKPIYAKTIAVLTNRGTIGTTELVVAALRDNGATTYGQYTEGNAVVQRAVKLSATERLHISCGIAISPIREEHFYRRGLKPDVRVVPILYSSDCTGNRAILPDGPWYMFSTNNRFGLNIPQLEGLILDEMPSEFLFDCQLEKAFVALKKQSE